MRDVGMVERRQRFGFALEARQTFGILREGLRQDLDGHLAIETGIAGAIHLAHAAGLVGAGSENGRSVNQ